MAVTTFVDQFWFGKDMREQIVISNGDFVLTNMESKMAIIIGKNLEESRRKIKEMGKDNNFMDFMRD